MQIKRDTVLLCPHCFNSIEMMISAEYTCTDKTLPVLTAVRMLCPVCNYDMFVVDRDLRKPIIQLLQRGIVTTHSCSIIHPGDHYSNYTDSPHLSKWKLTDEMNPFAKGSGGPRYIGPYIIMTKVGDTAAQCMHDALESYFADEEFIVDYHLIGAANYFVTKTLPIPKLHQTIQLTCTVPDYNPDTLRTACSVLQEYVDLWVSMMDDEGVRRSTKGPKSVRAGASYAFLYPNREIDPLAVIEDDSDIPMV